MVDEKKKIVAQDESLYMCFCASTITPTPQKKKIFRQMNKSTRDKLNKINAH